MQKLFIILLIAFLVSCKKSEDPAPNIETKIYEEEQVLGKWVYDKVKINGNLSTYEHQATCEKDRFYLKKYPNYKAYHEMLSRDANCTFASFYTDWELDKDELILNLGNNSSIKYKILRLDSAHFDVSIRVDYDQDGKPDKVEIYTLKEDCGDDILCR